MIYSQFCAFFGSFLPFFSPYLACILAAHLASLFANGATMLCRRHEAAPSPFSSEQPCEPTSCNFPPLVQIPPAGGWLLWGSGCWGPLTPRQKQ